MRPRRALQRTALPVVDYAPGHFTAPVRAWFGTHWQPAVVWGSSSMSLVASQSRERGMAEGKWWAAGTLGGLSAKSDAELLTRRLLKVASTGAPHGSR